MNNLSEKNICVGLIVLVIIGIALWPFLWPSGRASFPPLDPVKPFDAVLSPHENPRMVPILAETSYLGSWLLVEPDGTSLTVRRGSDETEFHGTAERHVLEVDADAVGKISLFEDADMASFGSQKVLVEIDLSQVEKKDAETTAAEALRLMNEDPYLVSDAETLSTKMTGATLGYVYSCVYAKGKVKMLSESIGGGSAEVITVQAQGGVNVKVSEVSKREINQLIALFVLPVRVQNGAGTPLADVDKVSGESGVPLPLSFGRSFSQAPSGEFISESLFEKLSANPDLLSRISDGAGNIQLTESGDRGPLSQSGPMEQRQHGLNQGLVDPVGKRQLGFHRSGDD